MQETLFRSLGQEDPLEKEVANHSSILAWEIPWTEEPGELQSMESQKSWTQLSSQTNRQQQLDARRMLLFMVEQVFLLMGEVWVMHNAGTQCRVGDEGRPKVREEFLCLNFSCLDTNKSFISQRLHR